MDLTGTRRFLLGLGAQKAGSTWAHSYLASDPSADFGPIKEYHVWDALFIPEMAHFDHRGRSALRNLGESTLRKLFGRSASVDGTRGRLQDSKQAYFDFFFDLLSGPGVSLTGDITPAYAGLPPDVLRDIRWGFETQGVAVKAMFLMRDPVARCISACQMNRRKASDTEGMPLDVDLDQAVRVYVTSKPARLRADYARTVETLRSVFDEKDLFFGLYEDLFEPTGLGRLSEFAGVSLRPELAGNQVNAHPKTQTVTEQTRAHLREVLDDTYVYCADAFPATRTLWMPHPAGLDQKRAKS